MRFLKLRRIHFVGIGGVGMSGLAELLRTYPLEVSGCDLAEGETTRRLEKLGIAVDRGHSPGHLDRADLLVTTAALSSANEEVAAARERGIPVIRRAEMLAEIMRLKQGIAIAGTHGKTTTTSMLGAILMEAGMDPTILVGGRAHSLGTNARPGGGEWLVAEADEFDRSFLALTPVLAVVTNIEEDHLDCYRDLADIVEAFVQFANRVPFYGAVFVCLDDEHSAELMPRVTRRIVTFGESPQASLTARNLTFEPDGTRMEIGGDDPGFGGPLFLPLAGRHNVRNALAALAVAREISIPFELAARALAKFDGVARRFERKGETGGVLVVDDYAHHPTEISATLSAARQVYPERRLVALFQPHLYSRTRDFAREFGRALLACDVALVTEIYASRESPIPGITGESVVEAARAFGHRRARYLALREDVAPALAELLQSGDILVTMGAGDVFRFGEQYLKESRDA